MSREPCAHGIRPPWECFDCVDEAEAARPKPYRPSNGTEGESFMGQWCARCALDCYGKEPPEDHPEEPQCDILAEAFAGNQPHEWIQDAKGPRCTAFKRDGEADTGFDPDGALGLLL